MSITLRSSQTIRNGITLRGNTIQYVQSPVLSSRLFEFDASNYTSGTTLLDVSGNGRNATIYGSPAWSSNAGGCFAFTADASKYIEVQDSSTGWGLNTAGNNPTASFSVWAKISAYGYYQHVAGWRGGFNFWFLILPGGTVEARFDGGASYDIGMDYSPYYDNWAQTTFVVDSANSQTRLYINSVLVGNYDGITGSFGEGVSGFRLGLDGVSNNFAANGAIGGATAYSRALTQQEVTSEFNRTKTRYGL